MSNANDVRHYALLSIFGWLLKKIQKIEKFCLKFEKLFLISAVETRGTLTYVKVQGRFCEIDLVTDTFIR